MRRYGPYVVNLSNLDRVVYPDSGITKGDVVGYYESIAPVMIRYLKDRPLSLQRFPDGIDQPGFFQKDAPRYFPPWIERVKVRKARGTLDHPLCNNTATLVYLANQGCITPHVWLSRITALDRPDQLVFDLDPPDDDFATVRWAALTLRALLDDLALPSFVKTSGGRGLHVTVALDRKARFDDVRTFARGVAEELIARHPRRLTIESRKAARGNRLYLDIARNAYAQTTVPAYALRPRPGAPVAAPLSWDEVEDPRLSPARFNLRSMPRRLDQTGDPWHGMARHGRSLAAASSQLARL